MGARLIVPKGLEETGFLSHGSSAIVVAAGEPVMLVEVCDVACCSKEEKKEEMAKVKRKGKERINGERKLMWSRILSPLQEGVGEGEI